MSDKTIVYECLECGNVQGKECECEVCGSALLWDEKLVEHFNLEK